MPKKIVIIGGVAAIVLIVASLFVDALSWWKNEIEGLSGYHVNALGGINSYGLSEVNDGYFSFEGGIILGTLVTGIGAVLCILAPSKSYAITGSVLIIVGPVLWMLLYLGYLEDFSLFFGSENIGSFTHSWGFGWGWPSTISAGALSLVGAITGVDDY